MKSYVSAVLRSFSVFGMVAMIATSQVIVAQQDGSKPASKPAPGAGPAPVVSRFSATATNLKRVNGQTITVEVTGWSPDAEREKIIALMEKGPNDVLAALREMPSKGRIWRSGSSFGTYVRYAVRIPEPTGGERVILAVDQDLSDWNAEFSGAATKSTSPFTVIELRITPKGTGEGKLSVGSKVAVDAANKTLALENYATAPLVLKSVKKESTVDKAAS